MTTLIFDVETDGLLPELTRIHCLVTENVETGEVKRHNNQPDTYLGIESGLRELEHADCIIGHNALGFDLKAIKKLYPSFKPKLCLDTVILSRLVWSDLKATDFNNLRKLGPDFPKNLIGLHSLKAWGYRLGILKGSIANDAGETDWSRWTPEMEDYCVQDVKVTRALWDLIQTKKPSEVSVTLEHQFASVMLMMEDHGFAFDTKTAIELYTTLSKRRLELEAQLQTVFPPKVIPMKTLEYYHVVGEPDNRYTTLAAAKEMGFNRKHLVDGPLKTRSIPFNPSSRDHIAERLIETYGWKPTEFGDNGKPTVDESVIGGLLYPEAKPLGEYLMLTKRIGQLAEGKEAWIKQERNGRIHGRINTNGAVTGRCTHSKPNLGQVPAASKDVPYGHECRSLFHAPAPFVLVGADASGIELRNLAHFMARYDGGEYAKVILEGDIHTVNQKAAGLDTRNQAKTFIYAWLYGAGDEKLGSIIGKGKKDGAELKARFLKNLPALKRLKEDVAETARRGYLLGLDKRVLPIRSSHAALNTLLQSAGALVMKKATCLLVENLTSSGLRWGTDWAICSHVHDEWQMESTPEHAETVGRTAVEAIRLAGEFFQFRIPLAGEYKIGRNWAETH